MKLKPTTPLGKLLDRASHDRLISYLGTMLKALPILLRLVLGSIFLFYGLDAFFHFVPNQTVSEPAGKFMDTN